MEERERREQLVFSEGGKGVTAEGAEARRGNLEFSSFLPPSAVRLKDEMVSLRTER
jgi:hypothetical protein